MRSKRLILAERKGLNHKDAAAVFLFSGSTDESKEV